MKPPRAPGDARATSRRGTMFALSVAAGRVDALKVRARVWRYRARSRRAGAGGVDAEGGGGAAEGSGGDVGGRGRGRGDAKASVGGGWPRAGGKRSILSSRSRPRARRGRSGWASTARGDRDAGARRNPETLRLTDDY